MLKKTVLLSMLVIIALSPVATTNARVKSNGDKNVSLGADGVPISPSGTVSTNVSPYTWSIISGATKYQVKIYHNN